MLTTKQINSLPKGKYSNYDLGKLFLSHGKKEREIILPIDNAGRIAFKNNTGFKRMRLNKKQFSHYAN